MAGSRESRFWDVMKHAFAIPEPQELTEQERAWLEKLADKVVERNLATPALFLLESCQPMNFVGSQAMVFFKPILSVLFDPKDCDRVADLLSRRGTIDTLIEMIETRQESDENSASGGTRSR
jgi:hypothetical protein